MKNRSFNIEVSRHKSLINIPILIVISLLAITLIFITTSRWGAGVISYDSTVYLDIAKNILRDASISAYSKIGEIIPIIKYPPLFSALIAMVSFLGVGIFKAAWIINSILLGANIFLFGYIILRYTKSILVSVFSSILFLVSPVMLNLYSAILSEPLFIFLGFFGLLLTFRYLESKKLVFLIISAILLALCLLTRYAALPFVLTSGIAILFFNKKINLKKRILHTLLFGLVSLIPMLAWMVRNFIVSGSFGRELVFHPINLDHIKGTVIVFFHWFLPVNIPGIIKIVIFFIILITLIILFVISFKKRRSLSENDKIKDLYSIVALLSIFIFIYAAFIFLSISLFDYQIPTNNRIFSPIFISLIITFAMLFRLFAFSFRRKVLFKTVSIIIFLYLLGFFIFQASSWIPETYRNGQGYSGRYWSESEIINEIEELPEDIPIYSNAQDAIYFLTARYTSMIPQEFDPNTNKENNTFDEEINDMRSSLSNKNGYIVYFDSVTRPYILEEDQIVEILKPFIYKDSSDGTIYKVVNEEILITDGTRLEYDINKSNFDKYFFPLNQCEISTENDNIKIKALGEDPYFESSSSLSISDYEKIIITILISVNSDTDYNHFQIFYKKTGSEYSEAASIKYPIKKGSNRYYIEITDPYGLEALRIDPINEEIDTFISEIKIYSAEN